MTTKKLIDAAKAVVMLTAITLAGWWCLTSTLDDMTRRDCQAGIQAACDAIK